MKTAQFYLIIAAASASLALTSCNKDDIRYDDGQLRLSTANVISETKAGTDLQSTQFASGEKVGIFLVEDGGNGSPATSGTDVTVYNSGAALEYSADGSGNLSNVQYWPTNGKGLYIYGVYPMAAATSAAKYDAQSVSFSVKDDQSSDDGYKASDLMTGVPESNPVTRTTSAVPLTFTHLLTKIKITLKPGVGFDGSDGSVSGLSNVKVSILGTKIATAFSVGKTDLAAASGDVTPIVACTDRSCESGGSIACAAIIVPQTVSSGSEFIKVEVGGGSYVYKLDNSDKTFEGQKVYEYEITVKKTGLTVTSAITDWTTVGSGTTTGEAVLQ